MDPNNQFPDDDWEKLKRFLARFLVWLNGIKAKGVFNIFKSDHAPLWIQAIVAIVMMATLIQNYTVIRQNSENQRVEAETRLNPELECIYDQPKKCFVFRNHGDAPANNIYIMYSIFNVSSNKVVQMVDVDMLNSIVTTNPFDKTILFPGQIKKTEGQCTLPANSEIDDFIKKYGSNVLICVSASYDRLEPTFRHYSGNFYFSRGSYSEFFKASLLMTESDDSRLSEMIEKYQHSPINDVKLEFYNIKNLSKQIYDGEFLTNEEYQMHVENWAKMHDH